MKTLIFAYSTYEPFLFSYQRFLNVPSNRGLTHLRGSFVHSAIEQSSLKLTSLARIFTSTVQVNETNTKKNKILEVDLNEFTMGEDFTNRQSVDTVRTGSYDR